MMDFNPVTLPHGRKGTQGRAGRSIPGALEPWLRIMPREHVGFPQRASSRNHVLQSLSGRGELA